MQAAANSTADSLLDAFRTIKAPERQKHVAVLDYWLSIRGDKEFPPLHDLDPLEISDAGPCSLLLELIGGGQDAEIRHLGDALQAEVTVSRIIDAPSPSLLSSIARKLPIVSISREFLAFEDSFSTSAGTTRCWVTLLPLSSCGSWVDYVYAFVSLDSGGAKSVAASEPAEVAEVAAETALDEPELAEDKVEPVADAVEADAVAETEASETAELEAEPLDLSDEVEEATVDASSDEVVEAPAPKSAPGFSKLLDGIANLTGFYGQGVNVDAVPTMELSDSASVESDLPAEVEADEAIEEPTADEIPIEAIEPEAGTSEESLLSEPDGPAPEIEPAVDEPATNELPAEEPQEVTNEQVEPRTAPVMEGPLQDQLAQVRAKAEEARQAQLRVTQALHESLSAAYDFALDAEGSPEEYLRLVEAQGVRIQLRAPMAPVARMAFDDVCDAATIRQFEAVLAWALKVELPRGALLERIESAGGIPELLNEFSKAA
ncbi:hypothetical protein LZ496_08805 [Sphingomonas sp. NSE70-1]|uniref:Uncharacterized protein n=1 Tax=Sphingomonas caseinilyticus TaxID=2908205 RepID=A0ABT0RV28_9SPHN|nr:hypothetical protein [Sphingomonas caseinilyticus]MCL6698877.1 hypothetical protein [Sphingomonas caseinilyticus]